MLVIISDSYLSRPTQMLWGWWLSTVRWIRAKLIQADIGWYEKNKHPMIKMVKRNCYHRAFLWSQIWTTPQLVSMGNLWWESENRKNVLLFPWKIIWSLFPIFQSHLFWDSCEKLSKVGLADRAKSIVRDLDPTNQLTFFRMKSESHEVERSFILLFKFYFDFFLIPVYIVGKF